MIDLSQNLLVPYAYAVLYYCHCGCGTKTPSIDYISPAEGTLEDEAVRAGCLVAAEQHAEHLRAKGYLNVTVEPRYSTPEIRLN